MENEDKSKIPPEELLRCTLEEKMSALKENRSAPQPVRDLELFLSRMLSDLLEKLYLELGKDDFDKWAQEAHLTPNEREVMRWSLGDSQLTADPIGERLGIGESTVRATFMRARRKLEKAPDPVNEAIGELIAYDCRAANAISQALLRMRRAYDQDPSQIIFPEGFQGRVKQAYEIGKEFKREKTTFESKFKEICSDPILGLYKQLSFEVWQHRIHRRYLRSRCGLRARDLRRLRFKRTRFAKSERMFWSWWNKNGRARSNQSPMFESDRRRYKDLILRENALLHYGQDRLVSTETRQTVWQNSIFLSFTSLYEKHQGTNFELKEFAQDILHRMKPILKDFHPIQLSSSLRLKQEFSLDYEDELINLTAWAANNLSLAVNQGAREVMEAEGKPALETMLQNIPSSLILALAEDRHENRFSAGSGKPSLLSRLGHMLSEERLLDSRHRALQQARVRKLKNPEDRIIISEGDSVVKPDDLAELSSEVQFQRDELRIDLENAIQRANLTPSELEVLELDLQDLTDKEIAEQLCKPLGTVKPLLFKAKKKLKLTIAKP